MNVLLRVFRILGRAAGWLVLAVVLALGGALIVVPSIAGATPLTVLTQSMEPSLPPGTVVVIKPAAAEEIAIGDVLTYQIQPGRPEVVSHRVIEVQSVSDGSFQFLTKGDNNDAADPEPVLAEQVKGVVWYSVPYIGWLTTNVLGQHRDILIPIAAGALLLFAAGTVLSTVRDARRKRRTGIDSPPAVVELDDAPLLAAPSR
ncbi:MAG TPA: signal peptidase I [Naasia sp.]|jgi:signal peptidase